MIGLLIGLFGACAASWLPLPKRVEVFELEKLGRGVRLEIPAQLRPDEIGWLDLTVLAAQDKSHGPAVITTRLDLAGLAAEGKDRGQVVLPEGEAHFRWKLQTQKSGTYAGSLWIYAGSEREPVSARQVQVEVRGAQMIWVWGARMVLSSVAIALCIFCFVRTLVRRGVVG
jgi:hypothetical protein